MKTLSIFIVPNFMIQGGDFTHFDGRGGESIYGGRFYENAFEVKMNKRYLLAMADSGTTGKNGSQFFITVSSLQFTLTARMMKWARLNLIF